MTLPIISADERLKETKGIKGCIFGKSGIGKTSLLWTMPAETTLFFDLEAGDLAIEGWQGDTIRPRTWQECRDFAVQPRRTRGRALRASEKIPPAQRAGQGF